MEEMISPSLDDRRHPYPPRFPQGHWQASYGGSNFVDGSGPLFSMYLDMAAEEDKKMVESWKADADGILVFTGLFSAAVAALISVSIQGVQPSSQNNFNSSSELSIPFSPPTHAVWVNSLWFLSLTISLTCALLATLLQQWARRYVKITQPRYSPHKRAHIRAFFAEGVDKLRLPLAVDALPLLLHLSLILFFAGLVVFLFNINQTMFSVVASWIGLCMAVYVWITFVPMFRHDSPYYTPLSSSSWFLVNGSLYLLCGAIQWLTSNSCFSSATWYRFYKLEEHFYICARNGLEKVAQETAQKVSPKIGSRALKWTLETSDEDHDLEKFFAGIPGICSSRVVDDPLASYIKPIADKMSAALIGLVHRTLSSNIISESVRRQRIIICKEAMKAASLPINQQITRRVFHQEWSGLLDSVEFGLFLRASHSDPYTAYHAQCMISIIIAGVEERDDRWFELASGHLDMSSSVLRDYLAHGDSVLLANCVHVVRLMVQSYATHCWAHEPDSVSKTLESVTKFDIRRSRPEVQREFCVLWNEAIRLAHNTENLDTRLLLNDILWVIGHMHIDLHRGSSVSTRPREIVWGIPWSYPLCDVESHYGCQSDSIAHFHEEVAETPDVSPRSRSYQLGASSTIIPPHVVTSVPSSPRLEPSNIQLSSDSLGTSSSNGRPAPQVFTELCPSSRANDLERNNIHPAIIDAASRIHEVLARSLYGEHDKSEMLSASLSVTFSIPLHGSFKSTATPSHSLSAAVPSAFLEVEDPVAPTLTSSSSLSPDTTLVNAPSQQRSSDSPTTRSNDISTVLVSISPGWTITFSLIVI